MTDQNQPGGTPGRWGENPAGESTPQPQQAQGWQAQQPWQAAHPGQDAANQYGAAPAAAPHSAAPAASGLFSPYVISGAAAVLMVIALVGFFTNWVKIVLDMSYAYAEAEMNGFGYIKYSGDIDASSEIDKTYLIFAALSIIAFVGALVQILVRKAPALGANMFISAGAFQLIGGVIGLIDNGKDGLSDSSALEEMLEVTKGPGQYIVIVTGVLLVGLGLLYRLRNNAGADPKPQVPAGFSGGTPGQSVQPGQDAAPGQYGNSVQPGQQGEYGAPGQPGFPGQQGKNGYPDSPNGSANPENPYGAPRP